MNRRDLFYNLEKRVTPKRLLNSVSQSYNNPMNDGKTLVLVEGYGDYRYYRKMLKEESVFIQSTSGCDNMNAILPILVKQQKCLAIQDSGCSQRQEPIGRILWQPHQCGGYRGGEW